MKLQIFYFLKFYKLNSNKVSSEITDLQSVVTSVVTSGSIRYRKKNGFVIFYVNGLFNLDVNPYQDHTIGTTLAPTYRPIDQVNCSLQSSLGNTSLEFYIKMDGSIHIYNRGIAVKGPWEGVATFVYPTN